MKKHIFYGFIIVFILFVLQLVMSVPRMSFGVFIKPLTDEFSWSRALISGAYSVSGIVMGLSGIFMGWYNDRAGPRVVTTISGILIGSGLILMYVVDSPWQLYLFYSVLIGLGMGGLFVPPMSTITRWFATRRNFMLSLLLVGGGLGGIIGPPVITWLIYTYTWQLAFLYVGIVVIVLTVLLAQFLKRDPSQMGLTPYQKGDEIHKITVADAEGLSLNQALHTLKFWLFTLIMFCFGYCLTTIMVHIVPYAIDRGISPATAAMILSVMIVALTSGCLVMGLITDKFGNRRVLIICECLFLSVLLLLLPVKSAWGTGIIVVILAFGSGGISIMQVSVIADLFGLKSNGAILGVNEFALTIGGSLGTFIAGLIFDTTGNYQWVFLLCGILTVSSIIMALFLNPRRNKIGIGKVLTPPANGK
jgi:MFS transporter, OFA family, oxalate/formate antiporter